MSPWGLFELCCKVSESGAGFNRLGMCLGLQYWTHPMAAGADVPAGTVSGRGACFVQSVTELGVVAVAERGGWGRRDASTGLIMVRAATRQMPSCPLDMHPLVCKPGRFLQAVLLLPCLATLLPTLRIYLCSSVASHAGRLRFGLRSHRALDICFLPTSCFMSPSFVKQNCHAVGKLGHQAPGFVADS